MYSRVSSTASYFLSELLYTPKDDMFRKKRLTLQVATVEALEQVVSATHGHLDTSNLEKIVHSGEYIEGDDSRHTHKRKLLSPETNSKQSKFDAKVEGQTRNELSNTSACDVQKVLKDKGQFVLDIDLDFFSTRNPFREMYSEKQYDLLRKIYQCAKPDCQNQEV